MVTIAGRRMRVSDLLLLLIISIFVVFKAQFIDLPFYWDEAWSYVPAVHAMYEHGPSLSPTSISPDHSRGHPLLFYFLGSVWMKIFGTDGSSIHWFALIVSVILIITTYVAGCRMASGSTGFFAALFLVINEAFLAQSGLFLPEVFLALMTLLMVLSYVDGQKGLVILFGTLSLFIKESAIVIIFTVLVWHIAKTIMQPRHSFKRSLIWAGAILLPVFILSIHFIYQRIHFGWFFFPEHVGLISFDLKDVIYKMKVSFLELFERQGIEWYLYAFAFVASAFFRPYNSVWRPALIILLYVAAIKVLFGRWTLPVIPTFLVTLACFTALWLMKFIPLFRLDRGKGEFLNISFLFTIGFIIFSSLNFYTDRYLLSIIPIFILGSIIYIEWALARFPRYVTLLLFTVLAGIQVLEIGSDEKIGDTRLSYVDAIDVQRRLIRSCESRNLYNEPVFGTFIEEFYMTHPIAGYLTSSKVFTEVSTSLNDRTRYLIRTNAYPNILMEESMHLPIDRIERIEKNFVWGELYALSTE